VHTTVTTHAMRRMLFLQKKIQVLALLRTPRIQLQQDCNKTTTRNSIVIYSTRVLAKNKIQYESPMRLPTGTGTMQLQP
jgi:hypothetical protein